MCTQILEFNAIKSNVRHEHKFFETDFLHLR